MASNRNQIRRFQEIIERKNQEDVEATVIEGPKEEVEEMLREDPETDVPDSRAETHKQLQEKRKEARQNRQAREDARFSVDLSTGSSIALDLDMDVEDPATRQPRSLVVKNPAKQPIDQILDNMDGIPDQRDLKRILDPGLDHLNPKRPRPSNDRQANIESFNKLVRALGEENNQLRDDVNAPWYDSIRMSNLGEVSQATGKQLAVDVVEPTLKAMAGIMFAQPRINESIASTMENISGIERPESTMQMQESLPDLSQANQTIETIFDFASHRTPGDMPSMEEREQAATEAVNEFAKKNDIDLDQVPTDQRALASSMIQQLDTNVQAIHSRNASVGTIGSNLFQALTVVAAEFGLFAATLRAFPQSARTSVSVNALGSAVAGGGTGPFVFGNPVEDDVDEIIANVQKGAAINLAFDGIVVGGVGMMKKGVALFRKADEMLSSTVPTEKLKRIKQTAQQFARQLDAGEGMRQFKDDFNKKEATRLANEFIERVSNIELKQSFGRELKSRFRKTFNLSSEQLNNVTEQILNYRYSKTSMDDLTTNEALDMDAWLWNVQENMEDASVRELRSIMERIGRDTTEITDAGIQRQLDELWDESHFLNQQDLTPDDFTNENMPVINRIFEMGRAEGPSDVMDVIPEPDAINRTPMKEFFLTNLEKAIGPSHILAKSTQKISMPEVPIVPAYWDVQLTHRRIARKAEEGFELADVSIPGMRDIDELFRQNNMWGKQNVEKQDELFEFLIGKEYDPSNLTRREMVNAGLDEDQINVMFGREGQEGLRDILDKLGQISDNDAGSLIRNYIPRRKNFSLEQQVDGILDKSSKQFDEPWFEQPRELGNLSVEDLRRLERQGVEFKKDLQDLTRQYIRGILRKTEFEPALRSFSQQVDRLKAQNHPDAQHWADWIDEKRGLSTRNYSSGRKLMEDTAKAVENIDPTRGKRFTNWLARNRPGDLIMGATWGSFLAAKQFFRIKNMSQTLLTFLERGADNAMDAHRIARSSGKGSVLDNVLRRSDVRGDQDQFLDVQMMMNEEQAASKSFVRRGLERVDEEILGFKNISQSDAFNVRRAFASGPIGLSKNVDAYMNGSIDFKQLAKRSNFETMRYTPKQMIKDAVDNQNVGMIRLDDGTQMRLTEFLDEFDSPQNIPEYELVDDSAEAILAREGTADTQWEYGNGAMGYAYWRQAGPFNRRSDVGELANLVQGATLPFTTWPINYAWKIGKWAGQPNVNADKLIAYATLGGAYAHGVDQVFEGERAKEWFLLGPVNSLPDLYWEQPGMQAAREASRLAILESRDLRGDVEEQFGVEDASELPWYAQQDRAEARRILARLIVGDSTFQGRALNLAGDVAAGSIEGGVLTYKVYENGLRSLTGGSVDGSRMKSILETIIGREFQEDIEGKNADEVEQMLKDLDR